MRLQTVGVLLSTANIIGVTSVEELIGRVQAFLQENPDICKNGILSIFRRACGHVVVVNSKVMELVGWDEKVPTIDGGTHDHYKWRNCL